MLLKHGSFETAQGVAAMRRPLEALADALRYLAPLEIYPDWSPPRDPAHVRVPLPAVATASAQKNSDNDASKALSNDQTSFWNSGSCKTAWWSVALDPPAPVASVQIQFRPQQMPDTVIVEVTSTGPGRSAPAWQVAATMSGKALGEFTLIEFREAFTAAQVRLTMSGRHPTHGGEDSYGVWHVDLAGPPPPPAKGAPPLPASAAETLAQLQLWLATAARAALHQDKQQLLQLEQQSGGAAGVIVQRGEMRDTFDAGVHALAALARASGSLGASLQLAELLLSSPQRTLASTAVEALSHLSHAIRLQIARQSALQAAAEQELSRSVLGAQESGSSKRFGPLPVAFDPAASSQGPLSFTNDGKTVSSTTGSHSFALLTAGPFTEGRASWEFRLDEDTSSQCSCFGAAIKPVVTANYESSKEMWMYRAYNGHRYANGSNIASGRSDEDKIKKGDTVRFELDFDEADGVIKMQINGKDKGVVFTGLKGKALHPAIAFYSSGRTITALSVEGPISAPSAANVPSGASSGGGGLPRPPSVFLADLSEHHVSVGVGELGKHGDTGSTDAASAATGSGAASGSAGAEIGKVKVAGAVPQWALCMQPPPGDGTSINDDEEDDDDEEEGTEGDTADVGQQLRSTLASSVAAADTAGSSAVDSPADQQQPEERRAAKLKAAAQLTKRKFSGSAATAVYWLGGAYESLRGAVALSETVPAELRATPGASPVVFEVYGDEALLWRSEPVHVVKAAPEEFCVQLTGVDSLRLVTRAVRGNAGAVAVWVNPALEHAGEWYCHGWRNHRSALTCAITGQRRGLVPAVRSAAGTLRAIAPAPAAGADKQFDANALLATTHGAAAALLQLTSLLAVEYLRHMRSSTPPRIESAGAEGKGSSATLPPYAEVDLESPYAVEASEAVLRSLARLLKGLSSGVLLPASGASSNGGGTIASRFLAVPSILALLQIARATLRRGVASGISYAAAGFAVAGDAGKTGSADKGQGKPSAALLELASEVQSVTTWGGRCAGVPLSQVPAAGDDTVAISAAAAAAVAGTPAADARCDPAVQDAAWLTLEYLPLGGTTALLLRKAGAGAGVLELELTWPWSGADPAPLGAAADASPLPVHMEALALSLQLHAAQHGWRSELVGCWPSRLAVIVDVPAAPGVAAFIAGDFSVLAKDAGAALSSAASGNNHTLASGLDFPLLLERSASFDRLARVDTLPGFGALHVYPGFVASFDDVRAAVSAFLPAEHDD